MNGRGRLHRLLPTAVALMAAAALFAVPGTVPDAARCPAADPSGVVPAGALTAPVAVRGCSLGGATVVDGALAVRVPANDGESVTAAGSGRGGHPAILTVARAAGTVRARIWRPDGGRVPYPHAPFSRFGRATGQPADPPADQPAEAPAESAKTPPVVAPPAVPKTVRCTDGAGAWLGTRWQAPYRWTLRLAGMPGYLGASEPVREAIRAAGAAVDDGHNDCGLTAGLALSQRYAGETERDAGVRADGTCAERDERNVVAFGRLDGGLLALTCLWWSRGRTVEADIRISDAPGTFTLDPTAGCTGSWDLQGTLTHEFGHVFGLGHVSYAEHGELTMSDGLPACSTGFRALGLGDYETLRAQYGNG
jgi:hypothetical protein